MRGLKFVIASVALTLSFVSVALAQPAVSPNDPTSAELVESPKQWDGREITFTGEAITEAQERGSYSWIHLNDDAYYLRNIEEGAPLGGYNSGQAVWIPTELTKQITYYGDFKHEGDVVQVTGVFNAACAQHGGDMDIHATGLKIIDVGRPVRELVHSSKIVVAIVLLALGLLLGWASRRAQHLDAFGALARHRRHRN